MKKVLATAIALVMVLAMGSAFALNCTWGWNCEATTYSCGVPSVQVVKFVKQTTSCGVELVENDCAAVFEDERVYYAIRVDVPKDINEVWWRNAQGLKVSYTRLNTLEDAVNYSEEAPENEWFYLPAWDDVKGGGTFWLLPEVDGEPTTAETTDPKAAYVEEDETEETIWTDTFSSDVIWQDKWAIRSCPTIKACITTNSTSDAIFEELMGTGISVMGWTISSEAADTWESITFTKNPDSESPTIITVVLNDDDGIDYIQYEKGETVIQVKGWGDGKKTLIGWDTNGNAASWGVDCAPGSTIVAWMNTFGIDFNSCLAKANFKANFFAKQTICSTASYSANATSVVDVNCEVEIPKTGDVSVIAYAVMALVTAAGAVGLKK